MVPSVGEHVAHTCVLGATCRCVSCSGAPHSAYQCSPRCVGAVPVLCALLGSKSTFDVLATVEFFEAASAFKLERADEGVRKMLVLIYSKEASVKTAVVQCYTHLYLTLSADAAERMSKHAAGLTIARNLMELTSGASVADLTSLEVRLTRPGLPPAPDAVAARGLARSLS